MPSIAELLVDLLNLTTPHLADGCLATGNAVRCAPAGVKGLSPGMRCVGRAQPVRHVGSIDIFFEAIRQLSDGAVLVVDNDGRTDEACIGDIVLLEAMAAGANGFVVWGLHRDCAELAEIGFPVFSLGSYPSGPQRLHTRSSDFLDRASIGPTIVTRSDFVVADANGVIFIDEQKLPEVVEAAKKYRETEAKQLGAMKSGRSFRDQIKFEAFLDKRKSDPAHGFRQHLKIISAAGEV